MRLLCKIRQLKHFADRFQAFLDVILAAFHHDHCAARLRLAGNQTIGISHAFFMRPPFASKHASPNSNHLDEPGFLQCSSVHRYLSIKRQAGMGIPCPAHFITRRQYAWMLLTPHLMHCSNLGRCLCGGLLAGLRSARQSLDFMKHPNLAKLWPQHLLNGRALSKDLPPRQSCWTYTKLLVVSRWAARGASFFNFNSAQQLLLLEVSPYCEGEQVIRERGAEALPSTC